MEKEYSVLLCSDYDWYIVDAMKAIGCEDYEIDDVHFESYVLERLTEGGSDGATYRLHHPAVILER